MLLQCSGLERILHGSKALCLRKGLFSRLRSFQSCCVSPIKWPARSNTASHPRARLGFSASVLSTVTTTAAYYAGPGKLHNALQCHCKGEDLRRNSFSALDGQQFLGVLSLIDEKSLPSHGDFGRCMAAYTCHANPKEPACACGCYGEAGVLSALRDSGYRGFMSSY